VATPSIDLSGYDNEDIDREFTLKVGTADSSVPYDISAVAFEAEIRDQNNALVARLTTNAGDGGIIKTDPTNGGFTIHIARGSIPYQPKLSLQYDLLMKSGTTFRRLWGGTVRISRGVTAP
jgi:hypothetical protein